jgi:hypothetical protein
MKEKKKRMRSQFDFFIFLFELQIAKKPQEKKKGAQEEFTVWE